jgi:hypothetical protein
MRLSSSNRETSQARAGTSLRCEDGGHKLGATLIPAEADADRVTFRSARQVYGDTNKPAQVHCRPNGAPAIDWILQ